MLKYLVLFFFFCGAGAKAQVWIPKNSWTDSSEREFAEFIDKNFHADFFTNPDSLGYNIPTDCADALYAARIVFAWKASLPIKFHHPNGGWISSNMTNWNSSDEVSRVKAFIRYVGDLSNTSTLELDTYPIEISREQFLVGTIYLSPILYDSEKIIAKQSGGHAEIVKAIDDSGYIRMLGSTTPKLVRALTSNRNPVHAPVVVRGGFRRFKQPAHLSMNTSSLPHYSLQQFHLSNWAPLTMLSRKQIYLWNEAVRTLIRTRNPSFEERVDVVVESICEIFKSRVDVVKAAADLIERRGNSCLRGSEHDDFSTPKKDARILDAYKQLDDMYKWRMLEGGYHNIKDAKDLLKVCVIEYWPGYKSDTWELFLRMIDGRIISDPNYSPAVRWGWKEKPANYSCK